MYTEGKKLQLCLCHTQKCKNKISSNTILLIGLSEQSLCQYTELTAILLLGINPTDKICKKNFNEDLKTSEIFISSGHIKQIMVHPCDGIPCSQKKRMKKLFMNWYRIRSEILTTKKLVRYRISYHLGKKEKIHMYHLYTIIFWWKFKKLITLIASRRGTGGQGDFYCRTYCIFKISSHFNVIT